MLLSLIDEGSYTDPPTSDGPFRHDATAVVQIRDTGFLKDIFDSSYLDITHYVSIFTLLYF